MQETKDARAETLIKIGAESKIDVRDFLKEESGAIVLLSEAIMKKLLLIIGAIAMLGFAAQPAHAGVHVGIGIGVPGYYGYGPYPAYGYGYPYGYPYYGYPAVGVYFGPGYYPWYGGYWHGGYYRGGGYYHGGYRHH